MLPGRMLRMECTQGRYVVTMQGPDAGATATAMLGQGCVFFS